MEKIEETDRLSYSLSVEKMRRAKAELALYQKEFDSLCKEHDRLMGLFATKYNIEAGDSWDDQGNIKKAKPTLSSVKA